MYPVVQGFLIGLLISVPTGPVGFLCVKRSLVAKYRSAVFSALGSITADIIFGLIAIFSITSVSHFFIHEQNTIRLFGGLLLLYVGIKTFFNTPLATIPGLEKYEELGNFTSTFVLTMTNPVQVITLPVVFAAIGTGVASNDYLGALQFLGGLFVGACVTWLLLIGFASSMRRYLKEHHMGLINKIAGILVSATGLFVLVNLIVNHYR
jgi:threonine/homoserine/homoserine lactone efflux protein